MSGKWTTPGNGGGGETSGPTPDFLNPGLPPARRAADLVGRMTLEEKAGQMLFEAPAIPRLGVAAYVWWNEALHGVARNGRATVFPQAIALAAAWDEPLMRQIARAIGVEARAKHEASVRLGRRAIYAGLTFWSPNINIFRDPRWGRGQETYGECPFLTARLGVAFVRGLQGDDPERLQAAACAKHFAVHSGPEALRHGFDAVVSRRDLMETYLPAFEALVREGKVEAVMPAYNRTLGEPCAASELLLNHFLRGRWGFAGHVVSDCGAIDDFHIHHRVTENPAESAALAVRRGCDLNCGATYKAIPAAIDAGLLDEADLDRAVTRLMATRLKLGEFDPPAARGGRHAAAGQVAGPAHRRLALRAAREGIVLLKNRNNTLPLSRERLGSVMVTGPGAASLEALLGNYCGHSARLTTLLEGIVGKIGEGAHVLFERGCPWTGDNRGVARFIAADCPVEAIVAVFGLSPNLEGEENAAMDSEANGDRVHLGLPEVQRQYFEHLASLGLPLIVVLTGGSPLAVPEVMEKADAALMAWYPGEAGGEAVADVLFGDVNPSGRLPTTFVRGVEQLPPFEDYAMRGRTYKYMTETPLLPFGFGLSYTHFAYDRARAAVKTGPGGSPEVTVSACLRNAGDRDGDEVAQVYVRPLAADPEAPLRRLAGFQRVRVKKGRTVRVRFVLRPESLATFDEQGDPHWIPGEYEAAIGGGQPGTEAWGAPASAFARFTLA